MKFKMIENHIFVDIPVAQKTYAKDYLSGVWSQGKKMWRFPKTYWSLVELAQSFPHLMQDEAFKRTGINLSQARSNLLHYKEAQDTTGDTRLRPYQRVDVKYLSKLQSAGIFNQPRTGKTPTSIMLMKELNTKRNLVIAPASLIWNWEKEVKTWWPEVKVFVYAGTPKKKGQIDLEWSKYQGLNPKQHVFIISKDTWKKESRLHEFSFDTCFVDEAAFLRNYKTAQSKAIFAVKAKHRYALTGTPTTSHVKDLYGILHFLYPDKFNSYWQFVERYFFIGKDWMGHPEVQEIKPYRQKELEEMVGLMSVQRMRKDVMSWLPDKEYTTIPVQMEGKQHTLYKRMVDEFIAYLEDEENSVDTAGILAQLMRLRQLCLDPRLLGFTVKGAKTDALLEYLDDHREPILIMSMFTSYLQLIKPELEQLGLRVGEINGKMDNKAKMGAASMFQKGEFDVLLCNIISAGTGFTLDRAETVLFTDLPYNPTEKSQAEDRLLPVDRSRLHKCSIINFTCRNTVDERIDSILENKTALTSIINDKSRIKELISK